MMRQRPKQPGHGVSSTSTMDHDDKLKKKQHHDDDETTTTTTTAATATNKKRFRWLQRSVMVSFLSSSQQRMTRRIIMMAVIVLLFLLTRQRRQMNHMNQHDEALIPQPPQQMPPLPLSRIRVVFDYGNNEEDDNLSILHDNNNKKKKQSASNFHPTIPLALQTKPNYGDLSVASSLSPENKKHFGREILEDDEQRYHKERRSFLKTMDVKLSSKYYRNDELDDYPHQQCVRPNWVWNLYPVCNNFHELAIAESLRSGSSSTTTTGSVGIRYLNAGASREAWLVEPSPTTTTTNNNNTKKHEEGTFPFVLKTLRTKYDAELETFRRVHIEALILERLSASDRTMDIYGHCGSSLTVEQGSDIYELIVPDQERPTTIISQKELEELQRDDVHPMNNFTAQEKLEIALAMAEGIAELHGYEGGVIVNSDIHIEQWVRSLVDGKIKLNDFNNGFFLNWDPKKKRYCSEYRSFGGDFHSPEEFRGDYVDEQIDVYSMGNNIHCLLTGLWQFPWESRNSKVQDLVIAGKRDHVDSRYRNRSLIEGRLVEIMERAWIHEPEKRATIVEVVQHLRETRRLHEKKQKIA